MFCVMIFLFFPTTRNSVCPLQILLRCYHDTNLLQTRDSDSMPNKIRSRMIYYEHEKSLDFHFIILQYFFRKSSLFCDHHPNNAEKPFYIWRKIKYNRPSYTQTSWLARATWKKNLVKFREESLGNYDFLHNSRI